MKNQIISLKELHKNLQKIAPFLKFRKQNITSKKFGNKLVYSFSSDKNFMDGFDHAYSKQSGLVICIDYNKK